MPELVSINEQQLDHDAVTVLRLLHSESDMTTTEVKSRLNHKNNDYTRRRFEWLESAGLVELSTEPWSQNENINVTVATISGDGEDFIESWNFEGLGNGLPLEERVRRLEDRVESLEVANAGLREELDKTNDNLESTRRGLQGQLNELSDATRAICHYLRKEVNVDLNEYRVSVSSGK